MACPFLIFRRSIKAQLLRQIFFCLLAYHMYAALHKLRFSLQLNLSKSPVISQGMQARNRKFGRSPFFINSSGRGNPATGKEGTSWLL